MTWRKLIFEDTDPIAFTGDITIVGSGKSLEVINLKAESPTELTIAVGAITRTQVWHRVDTEADAVSDDLDTIAGGSDGLFIIIRTEDDARTVVVRHNQSPAGANNILLANGDNASLDTVNKWIMLIYDALLDTNGAWVEMSRGVGAPAVLTPAAPVDVDHAAGAVGTAGDAARQDHKHDLDEGVAATLAPVDGTAEALGTANAVPHLDHIHALGPLVAAIDCGQQQLQRQVLHTVTTPPDAASEVEGQLYFDTTVGDKHAYIWVP